MLRILILTFTAPLLAHAAIERLFEIQGLIEPRIEASVSIFGANEPFAQATLANGGKFQFTHLRAGTYTVAAIAPGRGEIRITVEAGPGTADAKGRIRVALSIPDARRADMQKRHSVAAPELAVSERARGEFEAAQKSLSRRDSEAAQKHLENAVALSPGFATAWNTLGTIAYQNQRFERAAECFEKALAANPPAYEPLVNLGGVLVNLGRFEEAREYNQHAVLVRPDDALANSQLGLTYFEMGEDAAAEKYLRRACELDPAHFSHPQLALAQIHIRQNRPHDAASDLEQFLKVHPDAANAAQLRKDAALLRQ